MDGSGKPIRLLRVERGRAEHVCGRGRVRRPAPPDTQRDIAALESWKINAVRLPLNETAAGINLSYPEDGGAAYRSAIVAYVDTLNAAGMAVILDLHWGAPGTELATGGEVMADESHSPAFWSSVAATFKGNRGGLRSLQRAPAPPLCLPGPRGCTVKGVKVAGDHQLISDVRDTGATIVVMVAGIDFAVNPSRVQDGDEPTTLVSG